VTDETDRFISRDVAYFRDVQYRDSTKLTARANLHTRYGTASTPWYSWVVQQITWSRDGTVLDVGCGPGWIWEQARHALSADLQLTLTDLSPGMVAEAVDRARANFGAVDGAVVNAQFLPFTESSFDVVVANHMLYHVPIWSGPSRNWRGSSAKTACSSPARMDRLICASSTRSRPRCSEEAR
jgi:2-polyprenyl-3-methyl-5-hydroxy-6-metoxy-1,4-benzoquinol methylase